jgi:hypothetical protein
MRDDATSSRFQILRNKPQRPQAGIDAACDRLPDVIAGQVDVLPGERRDVRQERIGDMMPLLPECFHGLFDVHGVP